MDTVSKTKIKWRVRFIAWWFGIEIRFGKTPQEANIMINDPPPYDYIYFGDGIVFVRTTSKDCVSMMNIKILHEIGHGILDFFGEEKDEMTEEHQANGAMFTLCALLRMPMPKSFERGSLNQKFREAIGHKNLH